MKQMTRRIRPIAVILTVLLLLSSCVGTKTPTQSSSENISSSGNEQQNSASESASNQENGSDISGQNASNSGNVEQNVSDNLYHVTAPKLAEKATGKVYYISASKGKNSNNGTSADTPFQSVDKLQSIKLSKGDRVLFSTDDTFKVNLTLTAGGAQDEPIVISSYGSGKKPVISGQITVKDAGGYVFSGLEFTGGGYGIRLSASKAVSAPIQITACDFRDLKQDSAEAASGNKLSFSNDWGFQGTGIAINSAVDKGISNLTVDNCNFYNLSVGIGAIPTVNRVYTKGSFASDKLLKAYIHDCNFQNVSGAGAVILTNASQVQLSSLNINGTGLEGVGKINSAGLRLAGTKDITVQGTAISETYAYSGSYTGSGILFEGYNDKVTVKNCQIYDNIGNAFEAKNDSALGTGKSTVSFTGCRLYNNNTAMKGGNTAFSVGNASVSIEAGELGLHNDAQTYKGAGISKNVAIYNASGKAIQASLPKSAEISTVKMGIGQAKITPEEKTFIWGYTDPDSANAKYSWCDPQTDILDDTWIKVMVFEDEKSKNRVAFVIADMCVLTEGEQVPEGTYARWAKKAGVSAQRLYVSTTHTHQGMGTLSEKYIARVDQALADAVSSMTKVKMGVTLTSDDIATNRRPNLGINNQLAFDNTLLLATFTSVKTGKPISYLTNIGVHQTALGNGRLDNAKYNTSEVIGNAMSYVEKQLGSGFHSVFINGAYGDAGPNIYDEYQAEYQTIVKRAKELGQKVIRIVQNVPSKPVSGVNGDTITTRVSYRPQEAMYFTGAHVGDLAFFGVSGEIFSSIGAAIKAASPYPYTITTANTNAFHSYMPSHTATQDGKGGYGVTSANHYKDDIEYFVEENAAKVLNGLKGATGTKLTIKSVMGSAGNINHTPKAFDADVSTCWQTSKLTDNWLQCDLGGNKQITKISVSFGDYSRLDPAGSYDILVSDSKNFNTYTVYATVKGNNACTQTFSRDGISGRYIRLVANGFAKDSGTLKIYEITMFGK